MTHTEGRGVGEGFTLPHNTTRTMADVWAEQDSAHPRPKRRLGGGGGRPKNPPKQPEVKAPYAGNERKLFVLRNFAGSFLHESCTGMTKNQSFAWRGTPSQLARVRSKFPDLIASEVA